MEYTKIRERLFELRDEKYRDFQAKLIPEVDPGRMIGVRTPDLRALAKEIKDEPETAEFLASLPHDYFDEDQLHAFVISQKKDFDECLRLTDEFLPYVNNWATCDQLSPKAFRKNTDGLIHHVLRWVTSDKVYTARFGIGMLMQHYLDDKFDPAYPAVVSSVRSDEYYVNMMIAWYFATALAKQYEAAVPYIEGYMLDAWTHNKAIQKCVESRRISDGTKEYLKTLRIRTKNPEEIRIKRISYFEAILNEAETDLRSGSDCEDNGFDGRFAALGAYYASNVWKDDFTADEAGLLPRDLPRGVLSEDGIYDVLTEFGK